jgi:hypothetical protein
MPGIHSDPDWIHRAYYPDHSSSAVSFLIWD